MAVPGKLSHKQQICCQAQIAVLQTGGRGYCSAC